MKEIAGVCSNTFKILIVDDIPLNLLLLDKMLKPFEFQLVKASNGREALHAIQERLGTPEEIDLAIVDLMMPDIDGYKVIEVLRNGSNDGEFNIPAHSKEKLPIVILSGMNFSEDMRCKYALVTAFNVYSVFAVVLLGTLFTMMRRGIGAKGCIRCKAVLFSSLIPLLPGIMNVKYFASPFFSMGFMLSVLILYVFVVTAAREKLYQSKTKFLQNMSHEIRTSLNMVYGFAQLLGMPEGSWTDEEREKYNTYINDNYRMLDLLLNDLIEYTQTNQKTFGVSCEPVDVVKICDSTLQSLQFAQSKSKQVQLQNELPDGFTIKSDARRIQQILMHMLFYGVQFASSDELLLSAKLNAGALELAVVDPNSSMSGMKELPVYVKNTLYDPDVDDLGVRIELCHRMACLLGGCIYIDTKSKDGVRIVLQMQNIL